MKLLLLPLKLTTEALWLAAGVARRILGRAPEPEQPSPVSPPPPPRKAPRAQPAAGSSGQPEPAGGFLIGAKVRLSEASAVKGVQVPAGALGRIESARGGAYGFLWYTDEGVPVLVRDVPGARLSGI